MSKFRSATLEVLRQAIQGGQPTQPSQEEQLKTAATESSKNVFGHRYDENSLSQQQVGEAISRRRPTQSAHPGARKFRIKRNDDDAD